MVLPEILQGSRPGLQRQIDWVLFSHEITIASRSFAGELFGEFHLRYVELQTEMMSLMTFDGRAWLKKSN